MSTDMSTMGADPTDIRKRIRKGVMFVFDTAQAIDRLPDCDLKIQMIAKHTAAMTKLGILYDQIEKVDPKSCWYGFAIDCPGCCCDDCKPLKTSIELHHIMTVEEFDRTRIQRAKEYYRSKEEDEI